MKKQVKILFVDDQKICHKMMELIITHKTEYELLSAYSGIEALELLNQHGESISVIISDILMNDCSGYELFDKIQSNPELKNTPFILQSGFTDQVSELRYSDGKLVPIIYKPYNSQQLLKLLSSVIA